VKAAVTVLVVVVVAIWKPAYSYIESSMLQFIDVSLPFLYTFFAHLSRMLRIKENICRIIATYL